MHFKYLHLWRTIYSVCVSVGVKELNQCNSLSRYCLHCGQIHVHISPTRNLLNFCFLHSGILSSKQNTVNLMMPLQFPFRVQSSMKCCLITNSNQIICYSWYIPSRVLRALSAHLCVVNKTLGVTVSLYFHFMNSLSQRCWDRWGWEMDSAFFSSSAIILRHSPLPTEPLWITRRWWWFILSGAPWICSWRFKTSFPTMFPAHLVPWGF